MKRFNMIVTYLQTHPVIGVVSAWSGSVIAFSTSVLTNDTTLKLIGAASLYIGFFVGILTALVKLIELFKLIRKK